jgi:alpha-L-fucosidase
MKTIKRSSILLILIFLVSNSFLFANNQKDTATDKGHLFDWGNYAMFIHWGLYSNLADVWNGKTYYGAGEWLMNKYMAGADRYEYMATAKTFNPSDFDAMKIAQLAKDAGMKYIIITSKHHDGFAMYHSECNKFNIYDATPFHRDPMKELSEACQKLGLGFGFYYSHNQDWTYPGGSGGPKVDKNGNKKTFDDYFNEKCVPQVEEITKNYGPMTLIWFDTPGNMSVDYSQKLVDIVHKNQPNALISGRIGNNLGDYKTLGDMEVPFNNVDGMWESVDVTNDSWGFVWYDNNWKSPKQILMNLLSTVARGGTYMLNVGPDGKGNVPEFAQNSLRSAGRWIAKYPQTVYGAGSSPWGHALEWGDVVSQGNTLYLLVYQWPSNGQLLLPGLKTAIKKATLLNPDGKATKLSFENKYNGVVFQVPFKRPDPLVSVIELTMANDSPEADPMFCVDPELGIQNLTIKSAELENCTMHKSSWMEKFGEWKYMYCSDDMGNNGKVIWKVYVPAAGTYDIEVKARGKSRCVWKVENDEGNFVQNQQLAPNIFSFRKLGWLKFNEPGVHTITLSMPEGGKGVETAGISITPISF